MVTVKKRIEWVDMGKFVCIMFVMLSHLESGTEALAKFYTPFFLAGFFFLSGYVHNQPDCFRVHLKKKARGLLWPWFVFSNGLILVSMVLSLAAGRNGEVNYLLRFGQNLMQIRGRGDEVWFVNALFVAFIPFYFFAKWERPGWALGLMYLMSLVDLPKLPWHLDHVFWAGLWMLLGYDFKRYGEGLFDRYNTHLTRAGLWIFYLLLVFGPAWLRAIPHLTGLVGILAVVATCKVLKSNRYVRFVGANTLTYFALHGWVYAAVEMVLMAAAGGFYEKCLQNPLTSNLLAVAITVVVSLVLVVPAEIINRWMPWMLGRKREKHAV